MSDLNVEVIGINRSDQAANNGLVVNYQTLPWIQDTNEVGVWNAWEVTWRDVRIVNGRGELAAVLNLTSHNLYDDSNRSLMKQLLRAEAVARDADADGLRDDWEALYLQDLAAMSGADDDPDGDGYRNAVEYAFGSDPRKGKSVPEVRVWSGTTDDGQKIQRLSMRRRAGDSMIYEWQHSQNLQDWEFVQDLPWTIEPIYDGTGTFRESVDRHLEEEAKTTFWRGQASAPPGG